MIRVYQFEKLKLTILHGYHPSLPPSLHSSWLPSPQGHLKKRKLEGGKAAAGPVGGTGTSTASVGSAGSKSVEEEVEEESKLV